MDESFNTLDENSCEDDNESRDMDYIEANRDEDITKTTLMKANFFLSHLKMSPYKKYSSFKAHISSLIIQLTEMLLNIRIGEINRVPNTIRHYVNNIEKAFKALSEYLIIEEGLPDADRFYHLLSSLDPYTVYKGEKTQTMCVLDIYMHIWHYVCNKQGMLPNVSDESSLNRNKYDESVDNDVKYQRIQSNAKLVNSDHISGSPPTSTAAATTTSTERYKSFLESTKRKVEHSLDGMDMRGVETETSRPLSRKGRHRYNGENNQHDNFSDNLGIAPSSLVSPLRRTNIPSYVGADGAHGCIGDLQGTGLHSDGVDESISPRRSQPDQYDEQPGRVVREKYPEEFLRFQWDRKALVTKTKKKINSRDTRVKTKIKSEMKRIALEYKARSKDKHLKMVNQNREIKRLRKIQLNESRRDAAKYSRLKKEITSEVDGRRKRREEVLKDNVMKMFREALEVEKKRIREDNNTTDIQTEHNHNAAIDREDNMAYYFRERMSMVNEAKDHDAKEFLIVQKSQEQELRRQIRYEKERCQSSIKSMRENIRFEEEAWKFDVKGDDFDFNSQINSLSSTPSRKRSTPRRSKCSSARKKRGGIKPSQLEKLYSAYGRTSSASP